MEVEIKAWLADIKQAITEIYLFYLIKKISTLFNVT